MSEINPAWWLLGAAVVTGALWLALTLAARRREQRARAESAVWLDGLRKAAANWPGARADVTVEGVWLAVAHVQFKVGLQVVADGGVADVAGERRLAAQGWRILRFAVDETLHDPAGCVNAVRALTRGAAESPVAVAPEDDPYAV